MTSVKRFDLAVKVLTFIEKKAHSPMKSSSPMSLIKDSVFL